MSGVNVFIVSYDIMDPKRLQKVHKTMKGFGEPIHYDQDRIMIIDLGNADGKVMDRVEFLGVNPQNLRERRLSFDDDLQEAQLL